MGLSTVMTGAPAAPSSRPCLPYALLNMRSIKLLHHQIACFEERQASRQTDDRQMDRQMHRQMHRHMFAASSDFTCRVEACKQTHGHTDARTDAQTDEQTDEQTHGQMMHI